MARAVVAWFDYISPYSYLALTQAEAFAQTHHVAWMVRPVLYPAILRATGLLGPAEVPVKRAYTIADIVRAAELLGVPLVGPPAHPFRSLLALRTTCLVQDEARAIVLAAAVSAAAWAEGQDLEDPEVVARAASRAGFDGPALVAEAASDEAKGRLRANTDEALAAGVFGVPTFRWNGEHFWGHDRLDHLAARLGGRIGSPLERGSAIAARPRGVDRPETPYGRW